MEQIQIICESLPYLLVGAVTTLEITVITLIIGSILGIPVALVRIYGGTLSSRLAAAFSHLLRTIPVLLVIFVFFFVIARLFNIGPMASACLALGIRSAAYQSEIFRGAVQSISYGQLMAARAQGMSKAKGIIYVIIPQAFRIFIPGWANEMAVVLKDSSFAFAVGVPELFRRATYVGARTFQPLPALLACALLYLFLTYAITSLTQFLGSRNLERGVAVE